MSSWRTLRPVGIVAALVLSLVGLGAAPASADYSTAARQGWGANNTVYAIAVRGNRVYIGGSFTRVINPATGGLVARSRIAAFDRTTGDLITSFNPVVDDTVRGIDVSADGSQVYLGGAFATVNGAARSHIAAVNASGQLVSGWNPSASGTVRDVELVGSNLFLAGTFGSVNGATRGGLARLTAATGALSTWKAVPTGGKPWTIMASPNGTSLLVGGAFTAIAGLSHPYLATVDLTTGVPDAWAPTPLCDGCEVYDVDADASAVYAAVGGPGGSAAKWSASTGSLLWSRRGDGNTQTVGLDGGTCYFGGHFGPTFSGQPRGQIVALNSDTGALLPWNPNLGTDYYPGLWAIDVGSDYLRIGGGFRSVNGGIPARYAEFPLL